MSETRTGRPAPSTPGRTLERERELARIRWVLDQAAGGQGRLLVIEGPSGIGKSHLLEQARALAGEAGIEVLRARGGARPAGAGGFAPTADPRPRPVWCGPVSKEARR